MGKLVLYLADGTMLHVPLDKERITIGRRADNDVCLPYPAVSGEHAAVVTILADSFLEDLGSTNGTLVNGKAVSKHFLNVHDQIDIGRQRLTYLADNDARVDPLPPDMVRNQQRGLSERVDPVRGVPLVPMPRIHTGRPAAVNRGILVGDEFEREMVQPARIVAAPARSLAPPPVRAPGRAPPDAAGSPPDRASTQRFMLPVQPPAPPPVAPSPAVPSPQPTAPRTPSVRVLSGPSTGRSVPFPNEQLSVGRVGMQVAIVRKSADGYRLIPVEGDQPPRINGAPVPADGSPLHPGDTFEVAGVRLELAVGS